MILFARCDHKKWIIIIRLYNHELMGKIENIKETNIWWLMIYAE